MTRLSLYLHIPFCTSKCDYCDFYSVPVKDISVIDRYIDILLQETQRRLGETAHTILKNDTIVIPSVYVGGGTPSLLGAAGITRLLEGLHSLTVSAKFGVRYDPHCEITVEANPETADKSFLKACADNGVTRLSLGVQSFNSEYRKALGRGGNGCRGDNVRQMDSSTTVAASTMAAASTMVDGELLTQTLSQSAAIFGSGLSVDLLCACLEKGGFERQKNILRHDIEKTLSFGPGHVSLYALSLEQNPPLAARLGKANIDGQMEDQTDKLWLLGRDMLIKAGFEQYEISNFALPGHRCIHNMQYWRMGNWIGIGPGASGTLNEPGRLQVVRQNFKSNIRGRDESGAVYGLRASYAPDVNLFLAGKSAPLTEELDRLTVIKETLLMGCRFIEGPDTALFKERFGKTIEETIPQTLKKWQTKDRMLFLNAFLIDAFQELDNSI